MAKLEALNLEIARLGGGADGEGASGSKRRLDDSAFVEESREIVEGVRDAVKEGEFIFFSPLGAELLLPPGLS